MHFHYDISENVMVSNSRTVINKNLTIDAIWGLIYLHLGFFVLI